jgi:hypothetical protein
LKLQKKYAKEKGQSLSDLVENYFKLVTNTRDIVNEEELSSKVKKLRGIIKVINDFDYKKELTEELSKKYGV